MAWRSKNRQIVLGAKRAPCSRASSSAKLGKRDVHLASTRSEDDVAICLDPLRATVAALRQTGRKSWLFSDTVAGAKASAVVYSLVLTCRACGVEPYAWLRHVLTELPLRPPVADIEDLMPFNFAERVRTRTPADARKQLLNATIRLVHQGIITLQPALDTACTEIRAYG